MKRGWRGLSMLTGLLALATMPGAADAAWMEAKSRHFTIASDGSETKLKEFAQKLEKFDFLLRRVTGIEDSEAGSPVRVFLLANDGKVSELARNGNARGFYDTSDRFAFAVLPRGGKMNDYDLGAEEILFHEYTHHFMLHHFPAAYPAWYVEGFAEFFSVVKFPKDGGIVFGNVPMFRAPGLVLGSPYPLKQLLERNADGLGAADGDRYYGTAWLLTHYFQYQPAHRQEISRYLKDVANGVPDMRLDSYFTGGVAGLEKDLRAYMKKGLSSSRLNDKEMAIGDISVAPLAAAQGALIEDELRLMRGARTEELPGIIRSLRQTAAKFPDSAHALTVLAEAEWQAEQKDEAMADADRALAIDSNLSRAHSVRARVWLDRAQDSDKAEDWKAALTAIVKANRTDLEDPVPLQLFYRYHRVKGGPMPQVGYDGLAKAFGLLPQHPDYRFAFAQALAAKGDYKQASRLLNPLAHSPHGSDMREAAVKLKAEFDAAAKEKPAVGAAAE
ncbi:MAG TPA: hypothetical protein VJ762_12550 [Sphingobium sp.]|nr:hypothetical protein [Sphingobium sp.]